MDRLVSFNNTIFFSIFLSLLVFGGPLYASIASLDSMKHEKPPVLTKHSISIDGEAINYTVSTGYLVLKKEDGTSRARIFYVAYTLDDVKDAAERPLTFSFNGGPGSSSVWLHLGVLGPRKVMMTDDGKTLPPPYKLIDNEYSWLDLTDMVFIDPVSTGFSRAVDEKEADEFHGVSGDIASVGDFIRRYISEKQRWASPKFVIGESYGTTRAAGLSAHLVSRYGIYLNGIVLVSAITDFQTARFDAGNDLPFVTFLPSYAASGWFHKKLAEPYQSMDLETFLEEVKTFARTEYLTGLAMGDELNKDRKEALTKKLADYTGLSPLWISRANNRINIHKFTKELLREDGQLIGRFDSRYTGTDMNLNGEYGERDPSYQPTIQGCFSATINDYLTRELGFKTDLPYEVLTGRVHPWSYDNARNRYLNTAKQLRSTMERNPDMKVWIANGYYDLATPYYATEYTVSHMGLSPAVRDNIIMTYYPAGHMMYLQKSSLMKMKKEAENFYEQAISELPE
ncbi:MAG: carboxypeptidase C (cathepsin A) [Limisphaerales bacterium]|jgi:carboxypeptidase C (cathepsin A)